MVVLLSLILSVASTKVQTQPEGEEGALLRLESSQHDFGEVKRRGGDLSYVLRVYNDGSLPLVITRVVTSCSCLKADFSSRPIAPNSSRELRLIYQPGKAEAGTFYKVVQIMSNSKDGRTIFTIRGNSIE